MSTSPMSPPEPDRLEFTSEEILADPVFDEPLFASDVRCHGGFIDGSYVSPRTSVRKPAIRAWQRRLRDEGQPIVDFPTKYLPPHYPNYEQAKLLLREGISDPVVRSLTTISIVEGFGAMIRDVPLPDLQRWIKEDIGGTALAHLRGGLFEAHARDEAGHRDQGGHKQMWEAARDLAFDHPEIPADVLLRMMSRPGRPRREPMYPELPEHMEPLVGAMANVMVIEIFAEDVFSWGERLLGDPEVSKAPEAASKMVSYIRADENPHVEYLRTALSEIRCRTLLTVDGGEIPGRELVDRILERQLRGIASTRPQEQREQLRSEIRDAIAEERLATELIRRFEDLDSGWTFPEGEEETVELLLA